MVLYARSAGRFARQVLADVLTVVWTVGWYLAGRALDAAVRVVADPARAAASAVAKARDGLASAADAAGKVPGVGPAVRHPLDDAAGGLSDVVASANAQVVAVENLATLVGWLAFLVPTLLWLVIWLPRRVRFVRNATAAQRYIDSAADLDLFALRAMALQPLHKVARISADPVAAWRSGDRAVIDQLAGLQLRSDGLAPPRRPSMAGTTGGSTAITKD